MTLEALCAPRSDVLVYDTFNAAAAAATACAASAGSFLFGNAPAVEPMTIAPGAQAPGAEGESRVQQQGRRKRRRRQRSVRNAEDAENQRMTHIAVERNRRRQMNEYLAVLRSLMPESYVQRTDQASVVSGAIDFVKELEQQQQSLEAQKLALRQRHQQQRGDTAAPVVERDVAPTPTRDPALAAEEAAAREAAAAAERPPFARFFRYPQYAWRHAPPRYDVGTASTAAVGAEEDASRASAVADVEVGMVVDAHASLRVMAPRRPGQLLKMVAGMQALGLAVLHLNVTAALGGELAIYTVSLKVEEGSGLTTAEDIAAAAHHVLCIIDTEAAEAAAQRLLAPAGAGQPAGTSFRQYEPGAAGGGGYSSST